MTGSTRDGEKKVTLPMMKILSPSRFPRKKKKDEIASYKGDSEGEFQLFMDKLKLHHGQFRKYFRMSVKQLEALLQMLAPLLRKQSSDYWETVDPVQHLQSV